MNNNEKIVLTQEEVNTVLAIIECFQEQNRYSYAEMNKHMGSITIEDMMKLQAKLKPDTVDPDYPDEDYSDDEDCAYEEYYSEEQSNWEFYHDSLLKY